MNYLEHQKITPFLRGLKKWTFIGLVMILAIIISCNSKEPNDVTFQNQAFGCANFIVYSQGSDNTVLCIIGDREVLGLSTSNQEFELPHNALTVSFNEFDGPIGNFYCDDVVGDEGEIINSYTANSGIVEIQISRDSLNVDPLGTTYEITLRVRNLEFDINGDIQEIEELIFEDVFVGWFPG